MRRAELFVLMVGLTLGGCSDAGRYQSSDLSGPLFLQTDTRSGQTRVCHAGGEIESVVRQAERVAPFDPELEERIAAIRARMAAERSASGGEGRDSVLGVDGDQDVSMVAEIFCGAWSRVNGDVG